MSAAAEPSAEYRVGEGSQGTCKEPNEGREDEGFRADRLA